jgi:hypothetical protein
MNSATGSADLVRLGGATPPFYSREGTMPSGSEKRREEKRREEKRSGS